MVWSNTFLILFTALFKPKIRQFALSFLWVINTCYWYIGLMIWHQGFKVIKLSRPKYFRTVPTDDTLLMMVRTLICFPGMDLMIQWQLFWKYRMFQLGMLFQIQLLWCSKLNSFPLPCRWSLPSDCQKILGHYCYSEQVQRILLRSYLVRVVVVFSLSLPQQQFRMYKLSIILLQQYWSPMTTANLSAFLAQCLLISQLLTRQQIYCNSMHRAKANCLKLNFRLQYQQKIQFLISRQTLCYVYTLSWLQIRQKMRCMILFLTLLLNSSYIFQSCQKRMRGLLWLVMVRSRSISMRMDFFYQEEMQFRQERRLSWRWQMRSLGAGGGFLRIGEGAGVSSGHSSITLVLDLLIFLRVRSPCLIVFLFLGSSQKRSL